MFNNSTTPADLNHLTIPVLFPFYTRILMTAIGVLILLVGLCGNILVPAVVWKNKYMRSSTNLFLVNLSVADLLVLVLCIPTVLVEVHTKPETWMLGKIMCKIIPFLEFTVTHVSVLTILAISFERYYAICYPLEAGYTCTKGRAAITITLVWLLSVAITTPILLVTEFWYAEHMDQSMVPICTMHVHTFWRKMYFIGTTFVFFTIPLIILITLYVVICKNLTEDKLVCSNRLSRKVSDGSTAMKCRRQVVVMLVAVVICFFVCLCPLRAFQLWITFVPLPEILALGPTTYHNLLFTFRTLTYFNSAINPIIYNVISSKFRDAFCKHLGLKSPERGRGPGCKLKHNLSGSNSTKISVVFDSYSYSNFYVKPKVEIRPSD